MPIRPTFPIALQDAAGMDLKAVLVVLLVLGFLGFLAWLCKRLPSPFNFLAWAVLAVAAFFVVIRFVQGL